MASSGTPRSGARNGTDRPSAGRMVGALVALGGSNPIARTALLIVLSLTIFLPGIAALGPTDRDEARFAQASRQMLESGDPVDIRFQDDARHKKPAGIYWMQAASAALAGGADAPIWAYRLPSALGGLLAALLAGWALRPLVGGRASFLAAAMTAGLLLLGVEAHIAKTDAMLLAAVLAAQGGLARLWFGVADDPREHAWNVVFFWTALAAGVLLKGPVILLPVGGTLLWMMVYERSPGGLGRLGAGWGLVWLLLLASPWFVAIGVKTGGEFFAASLGEDLLAKVTEGKEAHWGPPGYYLAAFWLTFWPWTALSLISLPWLWRWRAAPEVAFLLGWIVPTWLVFEFTATKLPHYVLPLYPAIAAIAAAAALDGAAKPRGWLFRIGAALWAAPALALPAVVALTPALVTGEIVWPAVALAIGGLVSLLMAWRWLLKGVWMGFVRAALIGAGLIYIGAYQFALPALSPLWISQRLTDEAERWRDCMAGDLGARPALAAVRYHEPSLVFLAGADTQLLAGAEAGDWAARRPGALVWVQTQAVKLGARLLEGAEYAPQPEAAAFEAAMRAAGGAPSALARAEGFNYSRGRLVKLTLYGRAGDPALERCRATLGGGAVGEAVGGGVGEGAPVGGAPVGGASVGGASVGGAASEGVAPEPEL